MKLTVASIVFLFAATGCIIEEKPANTAPPATAVPAPAPAPAAPEPVATASGAEPAAPAPVATPAPEKPHQRPVLQSAP